MDRFRNLKVSLFILAFSIFLLNPGLSLAQGETPKTVDELYPGLASDSLKSANLAKLPKGTLLTSRSLIIKESELTREINQSDPALRKQLIKNAFYLLEKMATKQLVLQEAHKAGYKKGSAEDQTITNFLSEKVKPGTISDEELKKFLYPEQGDDWECFI